ncbi:hypothetical protein WJX74_008774 [Apatococcus lobatus]|uniref:UTP-monosaccharide-1-phosphate uridylyltransferase n=1 Tax=Apatococcus lobatus TaxID=904363 RepID=A0AAW1QJD0_9CHLO
MGKPLVHEQSQVAIGLAAGAAVIASAVAAFLAYNELRRRGKPLRINNQKDSSNVEGALKGKHGKLVSDLLALDQRHLFDGWPDDGAHEASGHQLLQQLQHLDANYNGGLKAYITNAKKLLQDAQAGANAFQGFTPEVPKGKKLTYASEKFEAYEQQGVKAAHGAAFVLVAGGLGERLGYSGIKLALPVDSARGACFLQVYTESILALQQLAQQQKPGCLLPLAIMTSDDTHQRTADLLAEHNHFGAEPSQITLIKQEKVACLVDNEAHLALDPSDRFKLLTKPHGHGDVHSLLHSSGLLQRWRSQGVSHICFFQDTNGLVFRALPAALGVSVAHDFDLNSLAVPRKAKEAIGGIARLTHRDGRSMTVNVEYNQLDPLLRATTHPDGDTNDSSGFSPFPGNINQLVVKADSYAQQLERTGGLIAEFVNPKYADSSRSKFKSPTRLECMMQDYAKELPSEARTGFTVIKEVWAAYSPVKNAPEDARAKVAAGSPSHSATTGELDIYHANCRTLQQLGAQVGEPDQCNFNGLDVELWPRISWSPTFALTLAQLKSKMDGEGLVISKGASLVIEGADVHIRNLRVDGALRIKSHARAHVLIDGLTVSNGGWNWRALNPDKPAKEEEWIRGFKVCRKDTEELTYSEPGDYVVPPKATRIQDNKAKQHAPEQAVQSA